MQQRPIVFVARQIPSIGIDLLKQVAEVRVHELPLPPTREQLLAGVKGCHGILSLLSDRIDGEVMDAAGSQLHVISNFAVGYNNIDVAEAKRRGIAVGNTPDVLTDATADIAVALLLAAARRLPEGGKAPKMAAGRLGNRWVGSAWICVAKRWVLLAWAASARQLPSDWCTAGE